MKTYKSIEDARAEAVAAGARCIIEIEHATDGRCYIGCKAPLHNLAIVLRNRPMPEIKRLVAEHPILTAAEVAAAREKTLREHTHCERCGVQIDGNTAYSQQERHQGMRVMASYCEPCRALLASIGAGECTELQERAAARQGHEPETKEDY